MLGLILLGFLVCLLWFCDMWELLVALYFSCKFRNAHSFVSSDPATFKERAANHLSSETDSYTPRTQTPVSTF